MLLLGCLLFLPPHSKRSHVASSGSVTLSLVCPKLMLRSNKYALVDSGYLFFLSVRPPRKVRQSHSLAMSGKARLSTALRKQWQRSAAPVFSDFASPASTAPTSVLPIPAFASGLPLPNRWPEEVKEVWLQLITSRALAPKEERLVGALVSPAIVRSVQQSLLLPSVFDSATPTKGVSTSSRALLHSLAPLLEEGTSVANLLLQAYLTETGENLAMAAQLNCPPTELATQLQRRSGALLLRATARQIEDSELHRCVVGSTSPTPTTKECSLVGLAIVGGVAQTGGLPLASAYFRHYLGPFVSSEIHLQNTSSGNPPPQQD
jgi:hypothetical protein